jgi:hypothetical protein
MFTNILIGLLAYSVVVGFFLVGWCRWQNRMARMDEQVMVSFKTTPRQL